MKFKLREIEEHDYIDLVLLFQEFALFEKLPEKMTNSVQQMIAEKDHIHGFVALNDANDVVGYVTYFYAYYTWIGKSMYMDDLYVRKAYRGLGLGTQLIGKVISIARAENCKKLRWQVSDWNKTAIGFYESA